MNSIEQYSNKQFSKIKIIKDNRDQFKLELLRLKMKFIIIKDQARQLIKLLLEDKRIIKLIKLNR